jgi:hypothetical protein
LKKRKDKKPLVSAALLLIAGIVALLRGHASWYGAGRISGAQVVAFSAVCLAFSVVFFVLYFRQ